ncbi:MAG: quinohemoprotein amine dehydrogenase subunit alpha, partial [Fimbriimonadaceae bacterium]|nr:quinohemoprotein amine dehydrogenase subunit alpha [Alphaproteobacteria bacterium]
RDAEEWLKLVHFHLGQYPTTEYQAMGRDRDWFDIAKGPVVKELAAAYPLQTQAWTDWQAHQVPDLAGSWRIVGNQPGRGFYSGSATISGGASDQYKLTVNLTYSDGSTSSREGNAILYSGHEWRAGTKDTNGTSIRQVVAVSQDGNAMSGRWYETDNDVIGGTIQANRVGNGAQVMAVDPAYIKLGQTSTVTIYGADLAGDVDLGNDLAGQVVERTADHIVVSVTSGKNTATGAHNISVGGASLTGGLMVYDRVDRVAVTPEVTIARVGGAGGPIPSVPAQFEAVGYMAGPDGEAGTDDDIRIGVMPATWSVDNFDESAVAMNDVDFAGNMSDSGLFMPAGAGPNPARKMNTNNAGNLAVTGTVDDDGNMVEGRAQLFVTVQRFVDALIR